MVSHGFKVVQDFDHQHIARPCRHLIQSIGFSVPHLQHGCEVAGVLELIEHKL